MNAAILKTVLLSTAVSLSAAVSADTRIVEVWSCTMLEGKKIEDVQAANANWVKFMNGKVAGGDIQSFVMTSVVGNSSGFTFADSFPSLAAWTAAKAAVKTPEGQAVEAGLATVSKCTSNTLHESTAS